MTARHANFARHASTRIISCELFILAANASLRRHGRRLRSSAPPPHHSLYVGELMRSFTAGNITGRRRCHGI